MTRIDGVSAVVGARLRPAIRLLPLLGIVLAILAACGSGSGGSGGSGY